MNDNPTAMVFLGKDDILVLEKEKGTVQRIIDGDTLEDPLPDFDVANQVERDLLGIAVASVCLLRMFFVLYRISTGKWS